MECAVAKPMTSSRPRRSAHSHPSSRPRIAVRGKLRPGSAQASVGDLSPAWTGPRLRRDDDVHGAAPAPISVARTCVVMQTLAFGRVVHADFETSFALRNARANAPSSRPRIAVRGKLRPGPTTSRRETSEMVIATLPTSSSPRRRGPVQAGPKSPFEAWTDPSRSLPRTAIRGRDVGVERAPIPFDFSICHPGRRAAEMVMVDRVIAPHGEPGPRAEIAISSVMLWVPALRCASAGMTTGRMRSR